MLKSTGIVRKADALGRIVLPIELRRTLGIIGDKDSLEIYTEDDKIILKKYDPSGMTPAQKGLEQLMEVAGSDAELVGYVQKIEKAFVAKGKC